MLSVRCMVSQSLQRWHILVFAAAHTTCTHLSVIGEAIIVIVNELTYRDNQAIVIITQAYRTSVMKDIRHAKVLM